MTDPCHDYRQQLVRLYGQRRAKASTIEPNGRGHYLVSVAIPEGDGFFLPIPVTHTQEEMKLMIANLSKRKNRHEH